MLSIFSCASSPSVLSSLQKIIIRKDTCQCSLQHYLHESNLMSSDRCIDKEDVVDVYSGALFQFSPSVMSGSVTPWTAVHHVSLSIANSQSSLRLMSVESVMPSNHLILCHPLLLLPSIFPSIRVFSSESTLRIRWPKYWSFSFNISPSNEYSGLISFTIDWFDLLAVQGTLKSLLQHQS